jgi:hypothetical protein
MIKQMKQICVVHLVRAHNGIEPFRHFIESYRANPGGVEHDLLIVFKGFNQPQDTAEYRELLSPFDYSTLDVSDEGFDVTAYFAAAKRYAEEYRYFCFLNSFSVIQDSGWLNKLYAQISRPGIGLVGATGSWQSHRGRAKLWQIPLYVLIHQYRKYGYKACWKISAASFQFGQLLWDCNPFPNYHVRTNAFMISCETVKKIECRKMKSKLDAHRFESGKNGLTSQILKMGKTILVVGKDGIGYEKEKWHDSRTFWNVDQENLLVADNQTRDYQCGEADRRRYLSNIAWGNRSNAFSHQVHDES